MTQKHDSAQFGHDLVYARNKSKFDLCDFGRQAGYLTGICITELGDIMRNYAKQVPSKVTLMHLCLQQNHFH